MGIAEIVRMLDASRHYVDRTSRQDVTFPEPEELRPSGWRVWKRSDIIDWAKKNGRKILY